MRRYAAGHLVANAALIRGDTGAGLMDQTSAIAAGNLVARTSWRNATSSGAETAVGLGALRVGSSNPIASAKGICV